MKKLLNKYFHFHTGWQMQKLEREDIVKGFLFLPLYAIWWLFEILFSPLSWLKDWLNKDFTP